MKATPLFLVFAAGAGAAPSLTAQAPSGAPMSEAALYALYIQRHEATAAFADLALTGGAGNDVRRAAENLARAHREARDRLQKAATERHLTIPPPEHDTTTALLEQARTALHGKSGPALDSTWAHLAYAWVSTLILDNNRSVKPRIGPNLASVAQEHTTWLFHQSTDLDKLRKKFK